MVSSDGKTIYYQWSTLMNPAEIWSLTGEQRTAITHDNDNLMRSVFVGTTESRTWTGADGAQVQGFVIKPPNFDPAKKYPVVEEIYAGPHGYFVPKEWGRQQRQHAIAELGFVVVQIDGMGTNWRSRAFHEDPV